MLTIKQFSSQLGVSTATISRAFYPNSRISEATRVRVLSAAQRLGYRPNIHARNLSREEIPSIALFYPTLVKGEPDYFIAELLLGINETAVESGLSLQVCPLPVHSPQLLENYCNTISCHGIAGIIVIHKSPETLKIVSAAQKAQLPYVLIGHFPEERKHSISYQIEQGAFHAGEHFLKCNRQHPFFIKGINDEEKICGFRQGLGPLANRLCYDVGGSTFNDGMQAALRILKTDCDAVFCANDILAIGFMRQALDLQVQIPKQIAVIGCDDVHIAQYYKPALTTIRFHEYEIGESAVARLKKQINNPSQEPDSLTIKSELIIRESA